MAKPAGKALVLLSGGIDSSVCLFLAVAERGPGRVLAVTFEWGQIAWPEEREASFAVARAAGVRPPAIVSIRFPYGGPLTGEAARIPAVGPCPASGSFFPARNLVMLSYAFGIAAVEGADAVYFGPAASDRPGYPDCRSEFVDAMEEAGNRALGGAGSSPISVLAPLVEMPKERIVELARRLGVPLESTFSCYAPVNGNPCGTCESCLDRKEAGA